MMSGISDIDHTEDKYLIGIDKSKPRPLLTQAAYSDMAERREGR